MIEERDATPTADAPGRFRGRRAPTALTAGETESSEVVARLSGTESSNPALSSGESGANLTGLRPEGAGRAGIFMTAGSEIAIALPNLPRSV